GRERVDASPSADKAMRCCVVGGGSGGGCPRSIYLFQGGGVTCGADVSTCYSLSPIAIDTKLQLKGDFWPEVHSRRTCRSGSPLIHHMNTETFSSWIMTIMHDRETC